MPSSLAYRAAFAFAACLGLASPTLAADNQWLGAAGTFWGQPENWSLGTPAEGQDVKLTTSTGDFTEVILTGSAAPSGALNSLLIQDSNGANPMQLDINNAGLEVGNGGITLGATGWGALRVNNSHVSSATLRVGDGTGNTGQVFVGGGTLDVAGDTTVGANGGTGTVTLNGTMTGGNIYVGRDGGNGTFTQNGGHNTLTGTLSLASGSGNPTGSYTLNGGTLSVGSIDLIGDNASFVDEGGIIRGLVNQQAGTFADGDFATHLRIDPSNITNFNFTGGTLQVFAIDQSDGTFDGSTMNVLIGDLGIRHYTLNGGTLKAGALVITRGGSVSSLGVTGGSVTAGTILLNGAEGQLFESGGTVTAASLTLGDSSFGRGRYSLSDAATLHVTGDETIGNGSGGSSFEQSGGTNTVDGALIVGSGGTAKYKLSGGTLTANRIAIGTGSSLNRTGGNVAFNVLDLQGGTFNIGFSYTNTAAVVGNGTIIGPVTNAGAMGPGHSTGEIDVVGSLVLTDSSVMDIELAGLSDFDRIVVKAGSSGPGHLHLDGELDLHAIDAFVPTIGSFFDVFSAVSIDGEIDDFGLFNHYLWDGEIVHLDGMDVYRVTFEGVPAPRTLAVLLSGLGVLGVLRRRKHRAP